MNFDFFNFDLLRCKGPYLRKIFGIIMIECQDAGLSEVKSSPFLLGGEWAKE